MGLKAHERRAAAAELPLCAGRVGVPGPRGRERRSRGEPRGRRARGTCGRCSRLRRRVRPPRCPARGSRSGSPGGGGEAPASTRSTRACSGPHVGEAEPASSRSPVPPVAAELLDARARQGARCSARSSAHEPVLLELPPSVARLRRAPGSSSAAVCGSRGPASHGFDERTWLRRHGVHVVVKARDWRARRATRRSRRLRRPGARLARRLDRPRPRGRAARGPRRDRARRGRGPRRRAAHELPRLGALPPAGGLRART